MFPNFIHSRMSKINPDDPNFAHLVRQIIFDEEKDKLLEPKNQNGVSSEPEPSSCGILKKQQPAFNISIINSDDSDKDPDFVVYEDSSDETEDSDLSGIRTIESYKCICIFERILSVFPKEIQHDTNYDNQFQMPMQELMRI
uniref:Protein Shroom3 n=1 Tax=Lygus hesperus TaxID=30085 RepID=A0A0A9X1U4_LYGHE